MTAGIQPVQAILAAGVAQRDRGLSPNQLTGTHIDLGLVVQHEFVFRQCAPDSFQAFVVAPHVAVVFCVENVETVAPAILAWYMA